MRIIFILFIFFTPFMVYARTDIIDGRIDSDTYWTKENSPYILYDYVNIRDGKSFTIGPGVTIMSATTTDTEQEPYSIYTEKGIDLLGSKDEPIKIINLGDLFLGNENRIENVIFTGTTIYVNRGTTTILSSKISDTDVAIDASASVIDIDNSDISDNSIGIFSNVWNPNPVLMYRDSTDYAIGGLGNAMGIDTEQNIITIHNSSIENNTEFSIINKTPNTIDARENWWGSPSGPDIMKIDGPVIIDPWKNKDFVKDICCSNVLFLPGLEASRLYRKEKGFFGTSTNTLWEPNKNDDVRKLFLDNDGYSKDSSIYTSDILDSAFRRKDIYKSFIAKMEAMVAEKTINKFLPFAYDWRMNVPEIVTGQTRYENKDKNLIEEIENLASTSRTGKVSIIAHSNGGILAKTLSRELERQGRSDLIDKVILIAVPELGTPQAVAGILHGDNQSMLAGIILTSGVARTLGINMSSAYGLLPSKEYFKRFNDSIITFADKTINSYNTFKDFLTGIFGNRIEPEEGDMKTPAVLKDNLLKKAELLHDSIDTWEFPRSIDIYSIIGWGRPTTKAIEYEKDFKNMQIKKDIDGDGTVLTRSAINNADRDIYFDQALFEKNKKKDISHNNILESDSINSFISTIISTTSTSITALPPYMTYEKPNTDDYPELSWITVSVHSPVDLNIYDSHGGHMGIISLPDHPDSDIMWMEDTIGGVYDIIGDEKYFTIPGNDNYSIQLKGTGYGTYTLNVEKFIGGDMISVASTTYRDLPVTPALLASTTVSSSSLAPVLDIDTNGDGKIDRKVKPKNKFENKFEKKKKNSDKDNNKDKNNKEKDHD